MGHPGDRLAGRTVVAAIADPVLARALAEQATRAGALLALACPDPATVVALNERGLPTLVAFAVGADDADAWQRLVAHVEQRLGPIDGVVVAPDSSWDAARVVTNLRAVAEAMTARGTGAVVWLAPSQPRSSKRRE